MENKTIIQEVIVVEGKNDTHRLKQFFDCETIETGGSGITKDTIDYIKKVKEHKNIIVFTDPDTPGEKLRIIINKAIPGCLNAFITADNARSKNKVGIEHASKQSLLEALSNTISYTKHQQDTIFQNDLIELGLSGKKESANLRERVSKELHIGTCNSKTFLKRLNMLQVSKEELQKKVSELND